MNPYQMAMQLRHVLRTIAWTTGAEDVVFGERGVTAFAGRPTVEQVPPGYPFCMVAIGTGTTDPDAMDVLTQQFELIYAVEVAGDPLGEHAIIGSSTANLGKSVGRGLLEDTGPFLLPEQVLVVLASLVSASLAARGVVRSKVTRILREAL